MRLIKPSIGECIDRLSVLARKIEEGPYVQRPNAHWQEEEKEIVVYLDGEGTLPLEVISLHLAAVNAMIWARQETADIIAGDPARIAERAKLFDELTYLNKRRAELVAKLSGDERSKEKI